MRRPDLRRASAPFGRLAKAVAGFVLVWTLSVGTSAGSSGGGGHVTARPHQLEPYRFFGDRTVVVPLLFHAPEPAEFTLRAALVQLTSSLEVPVGSEFEVAVPSAPFSLRGIEVDLSVPLPAVERETDFELRIRSHRNGEDVWYAAGRFGLKVYPGDLLSPVRDWAKAHPLRVEDDQGSLLQFLREQGIAVVEARRAKGFGDTRGVTLYAGPRALRNSARSARRDDETIVLFTERETEIPHLLIERTGQGTVVRVEMHFIESLASDPLAQKIFVEVFRLLQQEEP